MGKDERMIYDNLSMYVVGHRDFEIPSNANKAYKPIMVGNYTGESQYLRDNIGDNISDKNLYYCELTACYWIWKNDNASDIVGICHYRRYFQMEGHILSFWIAFECILQKKYAESEVSGCHVSAK